MKRITAIGFVALSLAFAPVTRAQYSADFQTNIISGVTSNWSGNYLVGSNTFADVLLIQSGGVLSNATGYLGYEVGGSNNSVFVTGAGSIWSNRSGILVGRSGTGNSLVISTGGQVVVGGGGSVGSGLSSNNSVIVTGNGSVWNCGFGPAVGDSGSGNALLISNDGKVIGTRGAVGFGSGSNNSVLVADSGSVWSNSGGFSMGVNGAGNSLTISNGGQVVVVNGTTFVGNQGSSNSIVVTGGSMLTPRLVIGDASVGCDNLVQLDSGSVIVTNSATNAVFEVRRGKFVMNGGTLQVNKFVMTDGCAQFIRTGGTLIYGTAVLTTNLDADGDGMANGWEQAYSLDPLNAADASVDNDGDGFTNLQEFQAGTDPTNASSAFRVLSLESTNNDILVTWQAGGGRTNVVQSAPDLTGSYSNVSPNIILTNVTGDVTTNFLDTGGATNGANRYYRIRLVP